MSSTIRIKADGLHKLRTIDERLVSYNVEMTEVTGGTFWKAYTPEQIAGTEAFPPLKDFSDTAGMMQLYPPVDLAGEKIRKYARALGSVYIRVSGSWATDTYYDFDGHTGGVVPEGYKAILTRERWDGLLDFVKAVDARLLISVSNCPGDHVGGKPWSPEQAKLLFDYSRDYGVPIAAAEFMNEPNMLPLTPPYEVYSVQDFGRDQDIFARFIRENYPEVLLVGPCACGDPFGGEGQGVSGFAHYVPTEELLAACREPMDVFSYHSYVGISDRGAALGGHHEADKAMSEPYLRVAACFAENYGRLRDEKYPGAPMWVTESADAGLGGNTWASTYLDVIRYADELGSFPTVTDGVIFHNTLASSDYGLLDRESHLPRPAYWLVYLWNQLMGTQVYDAGEPVREGAHVYVHSRRDGKEGYAYLLINNSETEPTMVELPVDGELYRLDAESLRAPYLRVNGVTLTGADAESDFAAIRPEKAPAGQLQLAPASVAFLLI